MRTLITGVTGFVGGHLAECLLAAADEVHGLARRSAWPPELTHLSSRVTLHAADLLDIDRVEAVLTEVRPERIAHLAGFADAGASFRDADAAWTGNLAATRNLYDAIAHCGLSPRILSVSTGQVYGPPSFPLPPWGGGLGWGPGASTPHPNPPPQGGREKEVTAGELRDESAELRPISPYAASKAAADLLSYQVTRHPGLPVIRVRPFNQVGPRQPPQYAAGHFARQLAWIEAGMAPPRLEVGDLSAARDLTDVRDMVDAYRLLLDRGRPGEVYNAGSGVAVRMADVLDLLRAECRVPIDVAPRPERMRPADSGAVLADASKLRRETGWAPRFALRQTLHDTLESWRHLAAGTAPSR